MFLTPIVLIEGRSESGPQPSSAFGIMLPITVGSRNSCLIELKYYCFQHKIDFMQCGFTFPITPRPTNSWIGEWVGGALSERPPPSHPRPSDLCCHCSGAHWSTNVGSLAGVYCDLKSEAIVVYSWWKVTCILGEVSCPLVFLGQLFVNLQMLGVSGGGSKKCVRDIHEHRHWCRRLLMQNDCTSAVVMTIH